MSEDLGTTEWLEVTQERVGPFADATDDHQWIHVDDAPTPRAVRHLSRTCYVAPRLIRDSEQQQIFDSTIHARLPVAQLAARKR